ncbi:MAG: 2-dehydropantoate 2-reductase N-terminal domain-containing protein [Ardenticatenia bacterium]|nr:2-dehydropantoate 2-reductase N-terminal domain-containing protein [Ardenticatenia bacterium]
MDWLIVGAGAIGSLLAGRLAWAGHRVTVVVRPRVADVVRQGLTLTDDRGRITVSVHVVTSVAEAFERWAPFDVIALTMKAFAVEEAARELRALGAALPPILTFQNGVGSEEIVRTTLAEPPLGAASISIPAELVAPGIVRVGPKGGICLAPVRGQPPLAAMNDALSGAGFSVHLVADYRAMKWSKLLLNMLGNATSAILAWPPNRIFRHPQLFEIEAEAWREARRVMRAYGIALVRLPGYPVPLFDWAVRRLPPWVLRPVVARLVAGGRGGKMPPSTWTWKQVVAAWKLTT